MYIVIDGDGRGRIGSKVGGEENEALGALESHHQIRRPRFSRTGIRGRSGRIQRSKFAAFKQPYLFKQMGEEGDPADQIGAVLLKGAGAAAFAGHYDVVK